MNNTVDVPREPIFPDDIILHIIDILSAENYLLDLTGPTPTVPDAWKDDVDWLLPRESITYSPPGRQYVRMFHDLSSSCLHQARKHIFSRITLTSHFHYSRYDLMINPPPRLQPGPPRLGDQLAFFRENTGPLSYIHSLSIDMTTQEMTDASLQRQIQQMLARLENLRKLAIHVYDPNRDSWRRSPAWTLIRSTFRDVLRSQTFEELRLHSLRDFYLIDLSHSTQFRSLTVRNSSFLVSDNDTDMVELGVKELAFIMEGRTRSRLFKPARDVLLSKDVNGHLRVTFSALKALRFDRFDINQKAVFKYIVDIVNAHASHTLERLELNIHIHPLERDHQENYSAWLNRMVLPLGRSLREISLSVLIMSNTEDPFGGLCSTLLRMASLEDNALVDVGILVILEAQCQLDDELVTDAWMALTRVFEGDCREWPCLERVSLKVVIHTNMPYETVAYPQLKGLRETCFKPLFSKPFNFEYAVRMQVMLLGLTGAGKSNFIERLHSDSNPNSNSSSTSTSALGISGNSLESVTQTPALYKLNNVVYSSHPHSNSNSSLRSSLRAAVPFVPRQRSIYIIDCPGFADTQLSEHRVVRMLQDWIEVNIRGFALNTILYFHRITDNRLSGSKRATVELMRALVGEPGGMIWTGVVTTRWDTLWTDKQKKSAEERFGELKEGCLKRAFGRTAAGDTFRFDNTQQSALHILDNVYRRHSKFPMGMLISPVWTYTNKEYRNSPFAGLVYRGMGERMEGVRKRLRVVDEEIGALVSMKAEDRCGGERGGTSASESEGAREVQVNENVLITGESSSVNDEDSQANQELLKILNKEKRELERSLMRLEEDLEDFGKAPRDFTPVDHPTWAQRVKRYFKARIGPSTYAFEEQDWVAAAENYPAQHMRPVPGFEHEELKDNVERVLPLRSSIYSPPGRQYVKSFHGLSYFCLNQARKHIFAHVTLTSQHYFYSDPRINPLPTHLDPPELANQLAFFRDHTGPLSHIRTLSIDMDRPEMEDTTLQAHIHEMLSRLHNLKKLEIHSYDIEHEKWEQLPNWGLIRPTFRDVFRSQALENLCLYSLQDFRISDLAGSPRLRKLNLIGTSILVSEDGKDVVEIGVKELALEGYVFFDRFEAVKGVLLSKNDKGHLRVKFLGFKAMRFNLHGRTYLPGVADIITAHADNTLEKLALKMWPSLLGDDPSIWLDKIILPRWSTLREISSEVIVNNDTQDPFGGLCSTLRRMGLQEHSALEVLEVQVTVNWNCSCATGEHVWTAFARVFEEGRKWPCLQRVMLKVVTYQYEALHRSLDIQLRGLREKCFKSLFSKPFEFDYVVHTYIQ
ncbi:hypothetical protein CVT24_005087 [Panaeolus cyanescens]|uniref:G domain-containing protein n=1 Tax=Panaeolus cyanescens TaxID=181874 RepID=A0A409YAY4_9AGAR|nr:hypothetical protein CVT24_005087 [Panaeolus cyanescens]